MRQGKPEHSAETSTAGYLARLFSKRQRISENSSVSEYLAASLLTLDGIACWVSVMVSCAAIVDLLSGFGIFPLKHRDNFSISLTALLLSPVMLFFLMVRLRQYFSAEYIISEIARAVVLAVFFILVNFI